MGKSPSGFGGLIWLPAGDVFMEVIGGLNAWLFEDPFTVQTAFPGGVFKVAHGNPQINTLEIGEI